MIISTEQKQAIERSGIEPVAIEDPESGSTYYLARADVYQKMRELVEIEHSEMIWPVDTSLLRKTPMAIWFRPCRFEAGLMMI